jgi:acetylornithine deacetylase/succinyl-diaminopimelate desuccinylase-like protein
VRRCYYHFGTCRTWRPQLEITGADGLPPTNRAGNVLRPITSLTLSLRLPPPVDAAGVAAALVDTVTADPPYGARVTLDVGQWANGWNAPPFPEWLWASIDRASQASFGTTAAAWGEGGSIPFMGMLGERFPAAHFVVTGVLGPASNAHGPNEFLHLPTAERVTGVIARLLHDHATER